MYNRDNDSTVNKTEYRSKRNPTGKPSWAWKTAKASGSLSQNRHTVWSPTHQRVIKEESEVANRDWVEHQACSLLQNINVIANFLWW